MRTCYYVRRRCFLIFEVDAHLALLQAEVQPLDRVLLVLLQHRRKAYDFYAQQPRDELFVAVELQAWQDERIDARLANFLQLVHDEFSVEILASAVLALTLKAISID